MSCMAGRSALWLQARRLGSGWLDADEGVGWDNAMAVLAGDVIARFEKHCPLTVQSRVILEYALSEDKVNTLFHDVAKMQYEKELLFSTTVRVMTDVVADDEAVGSSSVPRSRRGAPRLPSVRLQQARRDRDDDLRGADPAQLRATASCGGRDGSDDARVGFWVPCKNH